jgi:hypothetical protein
VKRFHDFDDIAHILPAVFFALFPVFGVEIVHAGVEGFFG